MVSFLNSNKKDSNHFIGRQILSKATNQFQNPLFMFDIINSRAATFQEYPYISEQTKSRVSFIDIKSKTNIVTK